ncbi:MAG: AAA family ATPase [Phycisphaerales bacterium]|nr:AAA family ATPase [Phycisphaerales bacterium]
MPTLWTSGGTPLCMRTIAIVNQKGGCGKTTTAINLSAQLARDGHPTLLVDLDPQGHCAAGLGVPEGSIKRGIGDLMSADLRYDVGFKDACWEVGKGHDLLPSRMRLAMLEQADGGIADRHDRDRRLEQVLDLVSDRYAFCIVDCSPSIGLLTFNALRAADETVIPVETGYFALKGAQRQVKTIEKLMEKVGRPADFFLLPTLHRPDSPRSEGVLRRLEETFPHQLVTVAIREHEELRESVSMGQVIQAHAPGSEAAADFAALAKWVVDHETTDVTRLRAERAADTTLKAQARATKAPLSAAYPESMQEPKPPSITAPLTTRVADVLKRVRTGVGGHRGIVDSESEPTELQAENRDRLPAQTVKMVDSDDDQQAFESASGLPERYGSVPTPSGVRFLQPAGEAGRIAVTGDFCGWSQEGLPLALDDSGRFHELEVALKPGRYEYQLIIDGVPAPDPYAALRVTGPDQTDRSVVQVVQEQVRHPEGAGMAGTDPDS